MRRLALPALALLAACRSSDKPAPAAAPPSIVVQAPTGAPATRRSVDDGASEDPRAQAVRAGYTKYEYRIAMRDGVRLFTSVYVPIDAGPKKKYPILISRTPYSCA